MGKKRELEELRWYEILMCCCKWRGECKACVTITMLYYVPIILLIAIGGACITIGVIWRDGCTYRSVIPYWVIVSSVTPFFPFYVSVKGMKDEYVGVTFWRILSLLVYIMFTAWVILGSAWIFDTWINASNTDCDYVMKLFSFVLVCVHWLIFALSTVGQIYILTQICCCSVENAIKPLKRKLDLKDDIL